MPNVTKTKTVPTTKESATRTPAVPSLAQMIREGQESDRRIKRASKEALADWFKQSERLNIAKVHYKLRGDRFVDFAKRIGIDRSSSFDLVKLWRYRTDIMSRCLDEAEAAAKRGGSFSYPGWRTALEWFEEPTRRNTMPHQHPVLDKNEERPTPQYIYDWINEQFGPFDLDVAATHRNAKCENYFTKAEDGLAQEWSGNVWLNPPYNGIERWARKAWEYAQTGKGAVTALLPVWTDTKWFNEYASHGYITVLTGRIRFPLGETGSAPFPNMIVVWRKRSARRGAELSVTVERRPDLPARQRT